MTKLLKSGLLKSGLLLAALLLLADAAAAQTSPVGRWRTIDDNTGEAKSVVEIVEEGGTLNGYIREIFREGAQEDVCEKCPADRGRGQPLLGLRILWGLKQDGEEWKDGEIMDPENGKVYGARLKTAEGGRRLEVRGFVRVPLMGSTLGRTQVWERVSE